MRVGRRAFLRFSLGAGAFGAMTRFASAARKRAVGAEELDAAAAEPVLSVPSLTSPVTIASIEVLWRGGTFFVRTRSRDGAVGLSVTNSQAALYYPILLKRVIPFFVNKDARRLDSLVDGVFTFRSNYKLQGQALWCPVAWVEFSILDMLGRITGKAVGDLLGGIRKKRIGIYVASGNRQNTPRQEAELLKRRVAETGAKAVKFKVGGRMSNNADSIPGRSVGLIVEARRVLGDDIALHADSNGSYDPPRAIEIGRLLEKVNATFFEEPCPFDRLEDTKRVADALSVPVAGGECESSQRRFRWMIENGGVDVVQPDLHYYGGFIRSTRVARMAAAAGLTITPHMSGGDFGYVEVLQFASFTPNIGPFMEYKGRVKNSAKWFDPPLKLEDGAIGIPEAPGLGLAIDPEKLAGATPVSTL